MKRTLGFFCTIKSSFNETESRFRVFCKSLLFVHVASISNFTFILSAFCRCRAILLLTVRCFRHSASSSPNCQLTDTHNKLPHKYHHIAYKVENIIKCANRCGCCCCCCCYCSYPYMLHHITQTTNTRHMKERTHTDELTNTYPTARDAIQQ